MQSAAAATGAVESADKVLLCVLTIQLVVGLLPNDIQCQLRNMSQTSRNWQDDFCFICRCDVKLMYIS